MGNPKKKIIIKKIKKEEKIQLIMMRWSYLGKWRSLSFDMHPKFTKLDND